MSVGQVFSVVQIFYIVTNFLSACSVGYWERSVEVSTYILYLWICLFFLPVLSVFASLSWSLLLDAVKIVFVWAYVSLSTVFAVVSNQLLRLLVQNCLLQWISESLSQKNYRISADLVTWAASDLISFLVVELSFTPFTETLYFKRASRRLWIYSSFLHPYVMPASHHPHPSLTPASASELGLRSPLSHGVLFTSFASQDLNSWLLLPASHLKCSAPVVFLLYILYFCLVSGPWRYLLVLSLIFLDLSHFIHFYSVFGA